MYLSYDSPELTDSWVKLAFLKPLRCLRFRLEEKHRAFVLNGYNCLKLVGKMG